VPGWGLKQATEPHWERSYNFLWQLRIVSIAQKLHARIGFDAVHHLTWGGIRAPTFLGTLSAPLIVGPLGGGETSPKLLRDAFHFKARMTETIRDLSNRAIMLNPLARHGLTRASVIFAKTCDTRLLFTPKMQRKIIDYLELGLLQRQPPRPNRTAGPPRLLFAGRLLYWKGAHIAIRVLAVLLKQEPQLRLTLVGKGKEQTRLAAEAAALGVSSAIDFMPWVSQNKLFELYRTHDLFVFPSLHDSSGNVVLEALSNGLPVVCLDVGGPKEIVTAESGVIVSTRGRNTEAVAAAMAEEILLILRSPDRFARLSIGAVNRANQFALSERVAQFYDIVLRHVRSEGRTAALF
jgi:glycosyltransferase involved in cell wall biosynthesis